MTDLRYNIILEKKEKEKNMFKCSKCKEFKMSFMSMVMLNASKPLFINRK